MMEDDDALIESSRLLPLTSDDSLENSLVMNDNRIPDLDFAKPSTSHTLLHATNGRTRKKIRLKRRDRNFRLTNGGHSHAFSSDSNHGRSISGLETDCFCRPCLSSTSTRHGRQSSSSAAAAMSSCTSIFLVFVVIVTSALLALTFFAVSLEGQLSTLTLQLDSVVEEKRLSMEQHRLMLSQFEALHINQTSMVNNLSSLLESIQLIENRLDTLNATLSGALQSLETAPYLKSLPESVVQSQKELADLGSKVTGLESELNNVQKDLQHNLDNIRVSLGNISTFSDVETSRRDRNHPRDVEEKLLSTKFVDKVQNVTLMLSTRVETLESKVKEIGDKVDTDNNLQKAMLTKTWELMGKLEDNVQNISAKAASNEHRCSENLEKIKTLDSQLVELEHRLITTTTTTATPATSSTSSRTITTSTVDERGKSQGGQGRNKP